MGSSNNKRFVCVMLLCVCVLCSCGDDGDGPAHDDHAEHDEHREHGDHGDHDDHGHGATTSGPELAVRFADEATGIELAPAAVERLGLGFRSLRSYVAGDGFVVPETAVVYSERRALVYLRSGERLRPVEVRVTGRSSDGLRLQWRGGAPEGNPDLIIAGAPLLHLAYLTAFGATGSGHGH